MVAKAKYVLTPEGVQREIEVVPGTVNTDERDIGLFFEQLGKRVPFDTGWLPPGVRSYRQVGDTAQVVIVCEPDINNVRWGQSEGQQNKPMYLVAQPWRVIIAQYVNGEFRGARMFYSPIPVYSPEQPLYHQNVPNLNCLGYGSGNGVGWVCLYHNQPVGDKSLGGKFMNTINRCSGQEPYNDNNMGGTHGPKIYQNKGKPVYTYNPKAWEKKTEDEGIDWVKDPGLWIPVLVKGQDDQTKHIDGGEPLTIEKAMMGAVAYYYGDTGMDTLKIHDRGKMPATDFVNKIVTPSFVSTPSGKPKKVEPKKVAKADGDAGPKLPGHQMFAAQPTMYKCGHCDGEFAANDIKYLPGINLKVCGGCMAAYAKCDFCAQWKTVADQINDNKDLGKKVCTTCQPKVLHCPACDKDVVDNHTCNDQLICYVCSNPIIMLQLVEAVQPAGGLKVIMHDICESQATACGNCGVIVRNIDTTTVAAIIEVNGHPVVAPFMMCPKCWTMCASCNMPGVRQVIDEQGACGVCVAQEKAEQAQPAEAQPIPVGVGAPQTQVTHQSLGFNPQVPVQPDEHGGAADLGFNTDPF